MPEPLRIPIRPDWDTALTYDSLHEGLAQRPVFVGRETLIAPLVAEIAEPNKRGTYLISGYRGTGKTTLLIEALTRAKTQLANNGFTLFPVVLNVSEVSASLGHTSEATPVALNIDPRRLLIALIRQMRDGISRLPTQTDSIKELTRDVNYAYQKATAAKFSVSATDAQEKTRTRLRELALSLDDKNVLKTVAVLAGAGAVAFEGAAWFRQFSWLHAAALWLGGISAVGLIASYKRSRSEKWTNVRQMALEHDNSLQQLETDLKDILAALKKNGLRTVVVLEELDKIKDPKGSELAAVISYFKNLFTQAPALFFFVTDKSYFDIVASAIKRARRDRSYAVEHTFFTHRIFVGRPTTEECLQFIAALAADETQRRAIEAVAETLGKPGRTNEADRLGRFIRVVLFSAANHMFDLKNELRLFARNEEKKVNGKPIQTTSFVIDDQTLPSEQEALAVFQDLIVEKSRSFEIKGGRAYANETLADSLYAVFNELGSNQPQKIDSFLPITNSDSTDALLLDEQLDLSEAARVRQAVQSLIADLERGGALQSRDQKENTFTWRDDAAREFRYIRQLQKHEEDLIAELQRNAALANALIGSGAPTVPHHLAVELQKRVSELRSAPEPLTADAAVVEQRLWLDMYRGALAESVNARLADLMKYGFTFESIAQGLGGSLHMVKPSSGDPRLSTTVPRGAVLLAFGEAETLEDDVWSFIAPTSPSLLQPTRIGLIHVIHTTGNVAAEIKNRKQRWNESLAKRALGGPDLRYAVEVLPLVNPREFVERKTLTEVQETAALLAELGAWARPERRFYEPLPIDTPLLTESLLEWKSSESLVYHIDGSTIGKARAFAERDDLEGDGTAILGLSDVVRGQNVFADIAVSCMLKGFEQASGPPEEWSPLGEWLLENDRVILYVDWEAKFSWTAEDILQTLESGAQVIITKSEALPAKFEEFGITKAPAPATASEYEPTR